MTVLGAIAAHELGVTLVHEHLLIDLRCLVEEAVEAWQGPLVGAEPTLENRGLLQLDPYVSASNLVLDDAGVASEELAVAKAFGVQTVVDLTTEGIGPQPVELREISRRTGVNIVAGCGIYTKRAHPGYVAESSEKELRGRLLKTINDGFGDTGIKPGIIGEIGTSNPIHDDEKKVLRAAAAAQRASGLALNVHVAIFGGLAVQVLEILEAAGADLSRVVISHMDELPDHAYHQSVLERGAYVEFDTFGSECYFDSSGEREPSDRERVDALLRLLDEGWTERLLISQDVCTKMQLVRYGGTGYGHIARTVVPRLRRAGVDQATLKTLLVENPARILAT